MMGGPFAGQNLPGTSTFGSKTPQERAQKWVAKYGDKQYKTPKQKQKKQQIKNIATMNQAPPGQNGGVNGGTGSSGGASLSSGMTTGQHAAFRSAKGGLAGLWRGQYKH